MRVFRDLGLVEQLGSGMSRILKVYDEKAFDFSGNFLVVTFPLEERFESSGTSATVNEPVNDTLNETANSTSAKILSCLKSNNNSKVSDIVEKLGFSRATVQREIKKLKDNGLLERVGSDKTGYWRVTD